METLLNNYDVYTYKQRENIRYIIKSTVVYVEEKDNVSIIRLKDSARLFYNFTLCNVDINDKVELTYKLIVEDQRLKAYATDFKKL